MAFTISDTASDIYLDGTLVMRRRPRRVYDELLDILSADYPRLVYTKEGPGYELSVLLSEDTGKSACAGYRMVTGLVDRGGADLHVGDIVRHVDSLIRYTVAKDGGTILLVSPEKSLIVGPDTDMSPYYLYSVPCMSGAVSGDLPQDLLAKLRRKPEERWKI